MEATMRYLGYVRVSTGRQARNGLSLDMQRERIEAMAAAQGAELADIVVEAGKSARSMRRPGVARVLQAVKRREVDGVVVYRLDRITRSLRDLTGLLDTFQRAGVALVSVTDNLDTSSPTGRLVIHILGAVAEMESAQIGERIAEAHAVRRAQGTRMGAIAYGRQLGENGLHLEDSPEEQQTIRAMKRLRRKGLSFAKIAARLNERGLLTRSGGTWRREYIFNILSRK